MTKQTLAFSHRNVVQYHEVYNNYKIYGLWNLHKNEMRKKIKRTQVKK